MGSRLGPDWVFEIKHDGYRLMVRKRDDAVRIFARRGADWTKRFPRPRAPKMEHSDKTVCGGLRDDTAQDLLDCGTCARLGLGKRNVI
jgi:hypothetical protein